MTGVPKELARIAKCGICDKMESSAQIVDKYQSELIIPKEVADMKEMAKKLQEQDELLRQLDAVGAVLVDDVVLAPRDGVSESTKRRVSTCSVLLRVLCTALGGRHRVRSAGNCYGARTRGRSPGNGWGETPRVAEKKGQDARVRDTLADDDGHERSIHMACALDRERRASSPAHRFCIAAIAWQLVERSALRQTPQ